MSKTYRDRQRLDEDAPEGREVDLVEGLIVDGSRGMYRVETPEGPVVCTIRGRLRKVLEYAENASVRRAARRVAVKPHDPVAVGDRVRVLVTSGSAPRTGVIEEVVARGGGAFTRRDPDRKPSDLTTVAGLDQMAIIVAARNPEPHLGLLDRFLVVAETQETTPIIVMSKVDLGMPEWLAERMDVYKRLGYPIVYTSVETGTGLEELRGRLAGKITALLGKSGVGKSSLLNLLEPTASQRISDVSAATGKGRHTTTGARLFPLSGPEGGYIADTAGIRALGLSSEAEHQLDWCFLEFRPYLGRCRLADCGHAHEPGCAVRDAVRFGTVDRLRYESYCRMRGAETGPDEELWEGEE